MSYLTWREYVRSGPICLGVLLIIAGAVMVLLPTMGISFTEWDTWIGAILAICGLGLVVCGFFFTKKKRDSVLTPVDTRVEDTPPPPPPPD